MIKKKMKPRMNDRLSDQQRDRATSPGIYFLSYGRANNINIRKKRPARPLNERKL